MEISPDTLFRIAKTQYQTYLEDGSWVGVNKKNSGFQATLTGAPNDNKKKKGQQIRREERWR